MPLYRATRDEVLTQLADEYLHNYGRGRTVLAIDGRDGAGKTVFAEDLALVLRKRGRHVFHGSIDAFHRPRAERYARGRTGETYYADAFDYSTFRRVLVEPFRLAGSAAFVLEAFDVRRDAPIEPKWTTAPDDAILIVDGVFLHRPELAGLWNYSIWLEAPLGVTSARLAARDGTDPDPAAEGNRRYVDGHERYVRAVDPSRAASVIVDNTEPDHPRRVFSDSC